MLDIDKYIAAAEEAVRQLEIPATPAGLYDPIRYTLQAGGKRIRPVLTLAVADAVAPDGRRRAANQAAAIEMFHNFTLLHDDVMDRADMRRGRPTVHRQWNEATAILSGDAMLTLAGAAMMKGCDEAQLRPVMELFNRTAMEIYEGQQHDMDFESRTDVTIGEYMEMIRLKTSVLLGCACALGAIMAGADSAVTDAFYGYGESLGLAFQLRDDYLDTYGDPATFGKQIGGDIACGKKTWLLINALAEDTTGTVAAEISDPSPREEKINRVRAVYDSLGLPQRCLGLIRRYADDAIVRLATVGLQPEAMDFFTRLAMQTVDRTR
ncbi:MAG: polyprenyl synthetase family protein [Paramuribaculum sp.]|nr:polyprenyl synthetase family protein [Paramuribaculum sp.]